MLRFLSIIVLLAACGSSTPPASRPVENSQPTLVDPPATAAPAPDCATAVQHVLDKMTPGGAVIAHRDLTVEHCNADDWSPRARTCMATAITADQGQGCFDDELTNEQRKLYGEDMAATFAGP